MRAYKHIVQYYETDKMGITHHSNYIRWMEEARVDYLQQIGWDYAKLEELGIISPLVSVDCQYKNTTTFSDEILIDVSVTEFKGIKLVLHYEMKNKDGKVVCEANSSHCFLDRNGRPIRLSKQFPEFNEKLLSLVS
ncbi:MAG: acyl-CoA thioesterase [Lachnospira sp.]